MISPFTQQGYTHIASVKFANIFKLVCLQPSSTLEWARTGLFNIFKNPERISLLTDKSREDSPQHASRLYAHLQTYTGLVWSFLIKSIVETFVMSVDENLSRDNSHKTISAILGCNSRGACLSAFFTSKITIKKKIWNTLKWQKGKR